MKRAIQCKYSCFKCGVYRVTVTVPARDTEDVAVWLETVAAPAMSRDHERRSPSCVIDRLSEVMIPMLEGVDKIGGVA